MICSGSFSIWRQTSLSLFCYLHLKEVNIFVDMEEPRESKGVIDKDKITETPGTLPYPHTIGSAEIKPFKKK